MKYTVTDFVTQACTSACKRHQAGQLAGQAAHQFGAAFHGSGAMFALAIVALIACGVWAVSPKRSS